MRVSGTLASGTMVPRSARGRIHPTHRARLMNSLRIYWLRFSTKPSAKLEPQGTDCAVTSQRNRHSSTSKCMLHWTTSLTASEPAPMLHMVPPHSESFFVPAAFRAEVDTTGAWVYAQDVEGKPGWICRPGATGSISFQLETVLGDVYLEYLQSYDNIGSVTCRIDDSADVFLDALIQEKVSAQAFVPIATNLSAGKHTLSCRSSGQKFNLLSLRAWVGGFSLR
ncbi:unnamed protein product [Prorocentrum cordatum]|uniref:Ig-like domain-containing protein n=1 Tax=Prorocentrum cordatum TaxID=2364126 RepID=A0ABN9RJT2_9DINO|nr:unnamed protein product [Polarella glacialis]